MKTRLTLAFALTLLACGGSSATIDPLREDVVAPPPEQTAAPPTQKLAPAEDAAAPGQDAGVDSSVPDASIEAAADSGADGGVVDPPPPPPPPVLRYGVDFTGANNQRLQADFPAGVAGQTQVTLEGYFSTRQVGSNGRLFYTPSAYCAVVTTGAYTGHVACCPDQSGANCAYSNVATPLNQYLHVAYVLSAGQWSLYVDGALQVTVASPYAAFPPPNVGGQVLFGALAGASPHLTVDEFRLSAAARYAAAFAPPAHLDADGDSKLTLLLDEGVGSSSGPATLSGCSWVAVNR